MKTIDTIVSVACHYPSFNREEVTDRFLLPEIFLLIIISELECCEVKYTQQVIEGEYHFYLQESPSNHVAPLFFNMREAQNALKLGDIQEYLKQYVPELMARLIAENSIEEDTD